MIEKNMDRKSPRSPPNPSPPPLSISNHSTLFSNLFASTAHINSNHYYNNTHCEFPPPSLLCEQTFHSSALIHSNADTMCLYPIELNNFWQHDRIARSIKKHLGGQLGPNSPARRIAPPPAAPPRTTPTAATEPQNQYQLRKLKRCIWYEWQVIARAVLQSAIWFQNTRFWILGWLIDNWLSYYCNRPTYWM